MSVGKNTITGVSAHGGLKFTSQRMGVGAYTDMLFVRITHNANANCMIIKMGCGCLHGDGRLFGTLQHTVGCVSYIFLDMKILQ